jgi:DNA repair protein SbcC/Rad50
MKIVLLKLIIKNFKGIPAMVIPFQNETYIYGANATGKTTIADAWYWCLFGMNSSDDKVFGIKNTVLTDLNEMDHEVEVHLLIDGEETVLRHVYREKRQKKRGATEKTYTGNENDYYWNGVPCQLKEWNAKIEKILSADTFKKITHPSYFCSTMPWQKRRETLIDMAGAVSDREIVGQDRQLNKLLDDMGKKTIKEYRSELGARKKKLKEDLEHIPARIDEAKRSLPEEEPDFDALQIQIDTAAKELNEIDLQLSNKNAAQKKFNDDQAAIQKEIHSLNRQHSDLQYKLRVVLENHDRNASSDIEAAQARIASLNTSIKQLEKDKADAKERITKYDATLAKMREDFSVINARQFEYPGFKFDESENTCPHCKQALPEADINTRKADLKKNYDTDREQKLVAFNNAKRRELDDLNATGTKTKGNKEEVEGCLKQITENLEKKQKELEEATNSLNILQSQFTQPEPIEVRLVEVMKHNKEVLSITASLEAKKALIKEEPAEENADAKQRKAELATLLTDLNKRMGLKETNAATNARIEKLGQDERDLSQKLADVEQEENLLMQFEKLRMGVINERVNGLFKYVKFKLFDYTIEGGEIPCCETMLNGVPYSDLNTAGRVKAGIDIINALSNHYNVYAPIFLDNRESVTEIPETESQVINLIVSPADKKLRFASAQMQEAV